MGQRLPGGTEDKKRPVNDKEHRFDSCSGKIPHVTEQLSPCVTTIEPRAWDLQLPSQCCRACDLQWLSQRFRAWNPQPLSQCFTAWNLQLLSQCFTAWNLQRLSQRFRAWDLQLPSQCFRAWDLQLLSQCTYCSCSPIREATTVRSPHTTTRE